MLESENLDRSNSACDTHTKDGSCVWLDSEDDYNEKFDILKIFKKILPDTYKDNSEYLNNKIITFLSECFDTEVLKQYTLELSDKYFQAERKYELTN